MATLKDVAQKACVDVSTVSRALNNTSYVHPETKARIVAAAKELGYRPNVMAKALRQGRRHTLGVIVPRLHLTLFSEILPGIEHEAERLGYSTLISATDDDPQREKSCLERMQNSFVDGIIITGTGRNNRLLRSIQASGIAVTQIVRCQEPRISSIVADYEASGRNAVDYLYSKGCRRIALIAGYSHQSPFKGRYEGYSKAIAAHGLEEILAESTQPVNSFEYGYECTNPASPGRAGAGCHLGPGRPAGAGRSARPERTGHPGAGAGQGHQHDRPRHRRDAGNQHDLHGDARL